MKKSTERNKINNQKVMTDLVFFSFLVNNLNIHAPARRIAVLFLVNRITFITIYLNPFYRGLLFSGVAHFFKTEIPNFANRVMAKIFSPSSPTEKKNLHPAARAQTAPTSNSSYPKVRSFSFNESTERLKVSTIESPTVRKRK